jgi:hypothetical protein
MKYLIFSTKELAEQRDHEEAVRRGCEGTTQYWWGVAELTSGFGLAVGEDPLQAGEEAVEATLKATPEV